MSSDRMGRLGERKFEDLCDRAGLSVSTPSPDLTGKDRLVEFPPLPLSGTMTYDTRPAPLSCYVQVKTLLAKNDRVEMRLSIAERLASELKPVFVVVLRIDETGNFVDMFLIHVEGKVLAAILKRLRVEQAQGTTRINIKDISFSISAGKPIDLTPEALRDALASEIGRDMYDYASRKRKQLKELGFSAGRYELNVKFCPLKMHEFVDGLLGLTELPVAKFQSFERRFGIPLPSDPNSSDTEEVTSTLRIEPRPHDRCTITVSDIANGAEPAAIVGDVYFPAITKLPLEHLKWIIKTDLFDFTFRHNGVTIKQNEGCEEGKLHNLEVLRQTFRVLKLLCEGECVVRIQSHKTDIDLSLPPCRLNDSGDFSWALRVVRVLEAAAELHRLAGVKDDPVQLHDLMSQEVEIIDAHAFMTGVADSSALQFTTDRPPSDTQLEANSFICTSPVIIGGVAYAYALRATLTPTVDGESIRWSSSNLQPLMVERIGDRPSDEYRRFIEKVARVSGVRNLISRELLE